MNFPKRVITYLIRNKWYSLILLISIFLLGTLTLASVFTGRLIAGVERNLWNSLPYVTMIEHDQYANERHFSRYGEWPAPTITSELIAEIAQLPYVESAYVSLRYRLYSRTLERYPGNELNNSQSYDEDSLRGFGILNVELFPINGVSQPYFAELSTGIIEIVAGTTFTDEQIEYRKPVVIISQELASKNGLDIGSTITLEDLVSQGSERFEDWYHDDNIIASFSIGFEVIGIYILQGILTDYAPLIDSSGQSIFLDDRSIRQQINMINTIYTPIGTVYQMLEFAYDIVLERWGESLSERSVDNIIVLNNAQDFVLFREAVTEILPDFIIARDVSHEIPHVFSAMDNIRETSTVIMLLIPTGVLIVLIILIMLLLRGRRHEIGIYLALGERKSLIALRFISEILLVTTLAGTLALVFSHPISLNLSRNAIAKEITGTVQGRMRGLEVGNSIFLRNEYLLDWFVPEVSEIEGLLEVFDVSLSSTDVVMFYAVSFAVVVLSTSVSLLYISRLKLKDILNQAKIQ